MAHKPIMINVFNQAKVSVTSGVMYWVVNAGTNVFTTIYSKASGTVKTNPISVAQYALDGGHIEFFTSQASVDIIVTNGKAVEVLEDITPNTRRPCVLNERPGLKTLIIPINSLAAGNSTDETDDGFDFPLGSVIENVDVRCSTLQAGAVIDVGILSTEDDGDANGFVAAATMAAAGFVDLGPIVTAGSNESYFSACYLGVLLADFLAGSDAVEDVGTFRRIRHRVASTGVSLSYTIDTDDVVGQLLVSYLYPGDNV